MQTAIRSKGKVFYSDIAFPSASQFNQPTKLPIVGLQRRTEPCRQCSEWWVSWWADWADSQTGRLYRDLKKNFDFRPGKRSASLNRNYMANKFIWNKRMHTCQAVWQEIMNYGRSREKIRVGGETGRSHLIVRPGIQISDILHWKSLEIRLTLDGRIIVHTWICVPWSPNNNKVPLWETSSS